MQQNLGTLRQLPGMSRQAIAQRANLRTPAQVLAQSQRVGSRPMRRTRRK